MSSAAVSKEVIEKGIKSIFNAYDSNQDGKLSHRDLTSLLSVTLKSLGKNRTVTKDEVIELIEEYDMNRDG